MLDLFAVKPLDPVTERSWEQAIRGATNEELMEFRLATERELGEYNLTLRDNRRVARQSGRFLPAHIMTLLESNRIILVRRLQAIQYHQARHRQQRREVAKVESAQREAARRQAQEDGHAPDLNACFIEVARAHLTSDTYENLLDLARARLERLPGPGL
jgi:hypothetical protein